MKVLSASDRREGLQWVLYHFREGADRFPELRELIDLASGPDHLLDRFIVEVCKSAAAQGRYDAWRRALLPAIYVAWHERVSPATTTKRNVAGAALADRKRQIIAAANRLTLLIDRNEAACKSELMQGLPSMHIEMRMPDLRPSLEALAQYAGKPARRRNDGPAVATFRREVFAVLGFFPTWPCLADLWNLMSMDAFNATGTAMRLAVRRGKGVHFGRVGM